jgi:polysaccharide export outer membrane protein
MKMRLGIVNAASVLGLLLAGAVAASAADDLLLPQTKLRLTVVQWNPAKGDYQSWQGLGGEFVISQSGTLQLPMIGQIGAAGRDSIALANEISSRLQARMGLIDKPDATVEILEYPPVYVVGDVTTPGEYRFRSGLTVLQALALSGGPLREAKESSEDQIRIVGELRDIRIDILHTKARIVRLDAEMAEASELVFPATQPGDADAALGADVEAQERIIFEARIKERERQAKSLEELRQLLRAEIGVLEQKVKAANIGVENAREELKNVNVLVEKGIAIASRRSELEQRLASYQAESLDQVTAIMRARQSITEATRNLDGLEDNHRTEVAATLQQEQVNLEKLMLRQDVSQKLLLESLASAAPFAKDPAALEFVLTRYNDGKTTEIAATDSTQLMPGDVVTVRLKAAPAAAAAADVSATTASLPTTGEALEASR